MPEARQAAEHVPLSKFKTNDVPCTSLKLKMTDVPCAAWVFRTCLVLNHFCLESEVSEFPIQPVHNRASCGRSREPEQHEFAERFAAIHIWLSFNQSLDNVNLPSDLQRFTVGSYSTKVWTT